MKRYALLTNVLVLLLALSSYAQKQENSSISALHLVYWEVHSPIGSDLSAKHKKTLTHASNASQIKIDYLIPPGVEDPTFVSGEKRETVIKEDGKQVTQATILSGPRAPFAPKDSWDTYKDFQKNEFISINAVGIAGSNGKYDYYLLREPRPDFGWRITEERKSIGGYECIKAVCA